MTKAKKPAQPKAAAGKKISKTVTEQLATALPELKALLGKKEFEKRIKKAAKKLVAGLKPTTEKKKPLKIKKVIPVKKKAVKAALKK